MYKRIVLLLIIIFTTSSQIYSETDKKQTIKSVELSNIKTTILPYIKVKSKVDNNKIANNDLDFNIHIPPKEALIIKYSHNKKQIEQYYFPTYQKLTDNAKYAIKKSPKWLRNDLRDLFVLLKSNFQDKWANCILDAEHPYIDEIAFSISALSPEYLSSMYAHKEMFTTNATYMYKYDSLLSYVNIKDYGNSDDDDFYSTTEYKFIDKNGDTVLKEIPKEIYYWYVVHPQMNDEIPGFVKIDQHESTHKGIMTKPQHGIFWREYMFEHNDPLIPNEDFGSYTSGINEKALITASKFVSEEEYKTLAQNILDSLQNIQIVWDNKNLGLKSPYINESYHPNNLIALLNRYAWSTTRFWSVSAVERPHQPARVLKWGMGRCGEFEDFTIALGRTALIPVTGIEGLSSDHVWNAFYDVTEDNNIGLNRWKVWETTITGFVNSYINHDKDGNRWASVNFVRSDGLTKDIISQYSNQKGLVRIIVRDSKYKPIDGARVILAAKQSKDNGILLDNSRLTDHDGIAEFEVGNGRVYYAKVFANGEEMPVGNSVTGVSNNMEVKDNTLHESTFRFAKIKLELMNHNKKDTIITSSTNKSIQFILNVDNEIINGKNLNSDMSDDMWSGTSIRENRHTNCKLLFFQLNEDNFNQFTKDNSSEFTAYNYNEFDSLDFETKLADDESYYVIRNDNEHNYIHLSGSILLKNATGGIDENFIPNVETGLELPNSTNVKINRKKSFKVFPNPSTGLINLQLPISMGTLKIFNEKGELVKTEIIISNNFTMDLNHLPNGLYFINIFDSNIIIGSEKIILNS